MSQVDGVRVRPLPVPVLGVFGLIWALLGVGMALLAGGVFPDAATAQLPGWLIGWVGYSLVLYFGFVRPHIAVVEGGVRYRGLDVETFVPHEAIEGVDTRSLRVIVLRLTDGGEVRAVVAGSTTRADAVAAAIRDGVAATRSTMLDDDRDGTSFGGLIGGGEAVVDESDDEPDHGVDGAAPSAEGDDVPDVAETPESERVDPEPTRRRVHDGVLVFAGVVLTFVGLVIAQIIGG